MSEINVKAGDLATYHKQVKVGDLVAFNMLEDTYWFEVLDIDRFNMTIREYDGHGTDYRTQTMDISCVKRVKQRRKSDAE